MAGPGPVILLLQAIRNLTRSGGIKTIKDAYRLAQRELGPRFNQLKKQVEDAFNQGKKELQQKPAPKKQPPKKEEPSNVIPFPKKKEGIMSTKESSPMMKNLEDVVSTLQKNPRRPGGGLDMTTGLTRALARRILEKKGIDFAGKDPLDAFSEIFGDSISDVKNLAEEMIEIDQRGGGMKDMDQMLEIEGLFDIELPTNPNQGIPDDEFLNILKEDKEAASLAPKLVERFELKQKYPGIDEELLTQIIDDPDPQNKAEALATLDQAMELANQGKNPDEIISILQRLKKTRRDNAEGGLNSLMASVDDPFFKDSDADENSFRMFNKPYKELTPDELEEFQEEMMRLMNKFASDPDPMDERNQVLEMMSMQTFGKPLRDLSDDQIIDLEEMFDDFISSGQPLPSDPTKPVNPFAPKPTGPTLPNRQMASRGAPSIKLAEGGLSYLLGV